MPGTLPKCSVSEAGSRMAMAVSQTFSDLLVSFMPRPMILSLCTNTHPTGVSSVESASSACTEIQQ